MLYLVGKTDRKYKIYDSDDNKFEYVGFDEVHDYLNSGFSITGFQWGKRGFVCRIYPNKKQAEKIDQTIGCCRQLYNEMLSEEIWCHDRDIIYDFNVSDMKQKFPYMYDVDSQALVQESMDLQTAFKNFFESISGKRKGEKVGFPQYKCKYINKRNYRSCTVNSNIKLTGVGKYRKLIMPMFNPSGRMGTKKALKIVVTEPINGTIKNVTIIHTKTDEYYVSILCECWIGTPVSKSEIDDDLGTIGIDGGIKTYLTVDDGNEFTKYDINNNETLKKALDKWERKLVQAQRKLAKMRFQSKNWIKQKHKVAGYNEKIKRLKQHYRHNVTTKLSAENSVIGIEDLALKEMSSNPTHKASKKVVSRGFHEVALGETFRQLEYKQNRRKHTLLRVDRYFPSSQLCNCCGYKYRDVSIKNLRVWTCPKCKSVHDRDENASRNIRNECIRLIS